MSPMRWYMAALAVGLLLSLPEGAAAAAHDEVVTRHTLPTDGLVLVQPCTREKLAFGGPITVEARTGLNGPGADVALRVRMEAVDAKGQESGTSYRSRDVLNAAAHVDTLPGVARAAVDAVFWGGGGRFLATVTLQVSFDKAGAVDVDLGNLALSCR